VTLAVTGNTISGQLFGVKGCWCLGASIVFDRKSMDIRWLSGRGKTPTLCVFLYLAAVMEKCCDACGDGEYYFRSGCFGVV
jgi:hypothetical protein